MSHRNARLTVHGRALLVERVLTDGWPAAHVAKELGISRQCAHRWVRRFRAQGPPGLVDRSSRTRSMPTKISPEREQAVLAARAQHRLGPARLVPLTGVPARTISRILNRHQVSPLAWLDLVTRALIRASRATPIRYEHARPGDLIHVDDACQALERLRGRTAHQFWPDNTSLATPMIDVRGLLGHKQITDYHHVNVAACRGGVLATLDGTIERSLKPADRRHVFTLKAL